MDDAEWRSRVRIVRSRRKTMEIRVHEDLTVTVRAPLRMSEEKIREFLRKKEGWILRSFRKMEEARLRLEEEGSCPPGPEEIRELKEQALRVIPEKVSYYAGILGVTYGRITLRAQKTRWGSCSAQGNLSFNCLLMLAPPEVLDYVVVHELCHRKEMNHSQRFWEEVEKVLPGYREPRKWLKERGTLLIRGTGASPE